MKILTNCKRELESYTNKISVFSLLGHLVLSAGFQANILYRVSHWLAVKKHRLLAKVIYRYNILLTGADISPYCTIGSNFYIPHSVGIVIGATSQIGNNVVILHGVTLGSRKIIVDNNVKRHPNIGDNVQIGANASIIGNISIANGCKVSPNKLVLDSIAQENTVV